MDAQAQQALDQTCEWARRELGARGIVAGGARLQGDSEAELDLLVLCDAPPRRFIRQRLHGVRVDLLPGSAALLRRELDAEVAAGRPMMAHLLDSGELLQDDDAGTMAQLMALAKARLQAGPGFTPAVLRRHRQLAAAAVQDALDALAQRSPEADRALRRAVDALLAHVYFRHGRFVPRVRQQLAALGELDPRAAQWLDEVLALPGLDAGTKLRDAARDLLPIEGFFGWDATLAALRAENAFEDTQPGRL